MYGKSACPVLRGAGDSTGVWTRYGGTAAKAGGQQRTQTSSCSLGRLLPTRSEVYKAKDTRRDRTAAIKVPLDAFMQERKLLRRWSISPLATMAPLLAVLLSASCADRESGPAVLTAALPLHLEDHLDAATIEGSEVPLDLLAAVEWRFDRPQPEWKAVRPVDPASRAVEMISSEGAMRLTLNETTHYYFWFESALGDLGLDGSGDLVGGIYVDLPVGSPMIGPTCLCVLAPRTRSGRSVSDST